MPTAATSSSPRRTAATATLFGVGLHASIITASVLAVLSAVRRARARGLLGDAARREAG